MKQKDIAVLVAVGGVSIILSIVLSGKIIGSTSHNQKAQVVAPISTQFSKPDPNYFNAQALDPTKLIQISNNSNTAPFNATGSP